MERLAFSAKFVFVAAMSTPRGNHVDDRFMERVKARRVSAVEDARGSLRGARKVEIRKKKEKVPHKHGLLVRLWAWLMLSGEARRHLLG